MEYFAIPQTQFAAVMAEVEDTTTVFDTPEIGRAHV